MTRLFTLAAMSVAVTVLLGGCNDDDSGVGSGTGGGGSGPTSLVGSDSTIAAWADPVSLGFDGAQVGSYGGARTFQRGNIDPITGSDLGQPAGVEIWEGSDGHVSIVDLVSTTDPAPVQLSMELAATANPLCTSNGTSEGAPNFDYAGVFFAADLAAPTNSTYVYRLPGTDGVCGTDDDVIHAVKTGMGNAVAPLVADAMPAATVYSSSGSIQGFVAKSGDTLVMEDSNLANPVALGTFAASIGVASPLPNGQVSGYATGRLFDVDGNIVFVDYAAQAVSASLFVIPNWTQANEHLVTAASTSTLYFAVNTPAVGLNPANATIYSMPNDGSAAPLPISTMSGTVNQMEVAVGGSDLVVGVSDTVYTISAFPLAGGPSVPLVTAAGDNEGRFTVTADDVYWTAWLATSDGTSTTRINTVSGINDMTGAAVLAPITNSMFMVGGMTDNFAPGDTTTLRLPFTTMFQVQNLSPVTVLLPGGGSVTQDGISGGTLFAVDASSNTASSALGTFPTSTATNLAQGTVRGLGGTVFLEATNPLGTQDPLTRDLYLVNVTAGGSLTQVTANL